MRKTIIMSLVALGVLGPAVASADLMINSAQIEVRSTDVGYDLHVLPDTTSEAAKSEFLGGDLLCDEPLTEVTNVGGQFAPCFTTNSFVAVLITLFIEQDQDVKWEFDADWGRGGIVFGDLIEDTQFAGDYNHVFNVGEPVTFWTTGTGSGELNILGFEACCSEMMSLRYSLDQGQTWFAAKVPEPGTLALLGLGLAGIGFSRRNKV